MLDQRARDDAASLVRLGAVQLHGDEAADYAAGISTPVIKAVTVANPQLATWPDHTTLLLDVHDPEKRGGTGRTVDWTPAAGSLWRGGSRRRRIR